MGLRAQPTNDQTRSEGNTQTKYTNTDEQTRSRCGDEGEERGEHRRNLKDKEGHGKSKQRHNKT